MRTTAILLFSALFCLTLPNLSLAGTTKAFVPEFTVSGPTGRGELKSALQGLLTSRLNPERVQLVDTLSKADVVIAGSCTLLGRMFSLDVLVKGANGRMFGRVYEQGEGEDDLIPAVGRLALKIDRELTRISPSTTTAVKTDAASYEGGRETEGKAPAARWTSPPLDGVFVGIALGRRLASGEREIFVAGERIVRWYLKGEKLKEVAEVVLPATSKVLGIDTADLDGDAITEIYVTVMDRESLSSRVYLPKEGKLEQIADGLPYFFRGIDQKGAPRKILVQEMDINGNFFGGVAELVKAGPRFQTVSPRKLPHLGNLFNSSLVTDGTGKDYGVVLNEDGHLVVTARDGRELWQSSDKFGGSEGHYKRETLEQRQSMGDQYRWTFLEQRMIVTPEGELLVPRNEGFLVVGKMRSYNRHSIHALRWNGSILEERWHSRQRPTYLADFAYDPTAGELVMLEVVHREGLLDKGSTVISVNKAD